MLRKALAVIILINAQCGRSDADSDTRFETANIADDLHTEQLIQSGNGSTRLRYPVGWYAPFWSGTGYGVEAVNYMLSALRSKAVNSADMWIQHHGDQERKEVRQGMSSDDQSDLTHLQAALNKSKPSIIVCHSLPTNWMLPNHMGWTGSQCPPDPRDIAYVYLIGRTMFETDRLPTHFVPRCNSMNEVWVPSNFSRDVFIASGVLPSKLRVVPEGINTTFWDPKKHMPIQMPQGELVFGVAAPPPVQGASSQQQPTQKDVKDVQDAAADSKDEEEDDSLASSTHAPAVRAAGGRPYYPSKLATVIVNTDPPKTTQQVLGTESVLTKPLGGGRALSSLLGFSGFGSGVAAGGSGQDQQGAQSRHGLIKRRKTRKQHPFRFLSSFKWEARKGWDVLLEAYLSEFTDQDDVELTIITKPFVGGTDYKRQMHTWAERMARVRYDNMLQQLKQAQAAAAAVATHLHKVGPSDRQTMDKGTKAADVQELISSPPPPAVLMNPPPFVFNASALPRLYVVHHHISDAELPKFYKAVDAFVLPSRGEGWGRPHVEAMAMGLPVISTNWSGITAYLDDTVGYPIQVDGLVSADPAVWWFRGLRWAQPSVSHLRALLRRVYTNRTEAAQRGAAARQRMINDYGPEAIGKVLAKEFQRVNDLIPSR